MKVNIEETRDYDQFSFIESNRPIDNRHVRDLIASINKRNRLKDYPITVNEKMQVVDGQHRLLAAKALDVPIYYKLDTEALEQDIILLNAHNKAWQLRDYEHFFVTHGNKNYIILNEFRLAHNLTISIALGLLGALDARPAEQVRLFKDGEFVVNNLEQATDVADRLVDIHDFTDLRVTTDRAFINALIAFCDQWDFDRLMKNLERGKTVVTRSMTEGDYLRQLYRIAGV